MPISEPSVDADLAKRIRDEAYHAKVLVRSIRNSTKTTAAALADSEARLDALLGELEDQPHAKEAQGDHTRAYEARQ